MLHLVTDDTPSASNSPSAPDPQLLELQRLTQLVEQMAADMDQMSCATESELHDLKNQIGRTSQEIRDLKTALPNPPPVLEDWNDTPNTPKTPATIQVIQQPAPTGEEPAVITKLDQLLKQQQQLPQTIEKITFQSFLASLGLQHWRWWLVGGVAAHIVLTVGLVIATSHLWPHSLSLHNEAHLFKIYQKIK